MIFQVVIYVTKFWETLSYTVIVIIQFSDKCHKGIKKFKHLPIKRNTKSYSAYILIINIRQSIYGL